MKKKYIPSILSFIFLSILIPVIITGCLPDFEPLPEIFDDPDQGIMTMETAVGIFKYLSNNNTVTISQFKDTEALKKYLKGAADPSTLFISTINNEPVTKIAARAFSPQDEAPDISKMIGKLRLADTVTVIDKTAFKGVGDKSFSLEIPETVLKSLTEEVLEAIKKDVTVIAPQAPEEPVPPPASEDKVITIADIPGITAPDIGGTPVTTIGNTDQYTGTVFWSNSPAVFAANTTYRADIYLTPKPGYTLTGVRENFFRVEGAVTTNGAGSGTVTAVFPKTSIIADSLAALNAAISQIEQDDIIRLSEAFYGEVNLKGESITIHGAATDNTVPYTIQGLGADPNAPPLTVGLLIANDNITLRDIKISIDDTDSSVDSRNISNDYYSAIAVARKDTQAFLNGANLVSRNVTVDNCYVTFRSSAAEKLAGIYVARALNGNLVPHVPNRVVIKNSFVNVAGTGNVAVQAVLVPPTVTVTGNTLTALGGDGTIYNPASAIFIEGVIASSSEQEIAPMTGNLLWGETFDFWIATPGDVGNDGMVIAVDNAINIDNALNGTGAGGAINMAALGFGTGDPDKVWALNSSGNTANNYFKLLQSLKSQCNETNRVGYGYIYLAMSINNNNQITASWVEEKYEIKNGQITAVDYWGYPENNGAAYNTGVAAVYGRIANGKAVPDDFHNNRDTQVGDNGPYN
ncbi:MAG: hypothetical protein LBP43_03165 [Treponema sp.]|jgi:hypothetical protein|nr:hypothetical protein [Treponema sp.]